MMMQDPGYLHKGNINFFGICCKYRNDVWLTANEHTKQRD